MREGQTTGDREAWRTHYLGGAEGPMADAKQSPEPDDTEPSPDRQAELQAAYEANVHAAGHAPYERVAIRTRGELLWVMRERDWSGEQDAQGKERANLFLADLRRADLREVHLEGADMGRARLNGANLSGAHLVAADLGVASLDAANLSRAILTGASLAGAYLDNANLSGARLDANLSGAYLLGANLAGTDLRGARLDANTTLTNAKIDTYTLLVDVAWNFASVMTLNWEDVTILGDERRARQAKTKDGKRKDRDTRLHEYRAAARANRQVATLLRAQGLNEFADHFGYRARVVQRQDLRRQGPRKWPAYFGSVLLDILAGYGYRWLRTLFWYIAVVGSFAFAYYQVTHGGALFGLVEPICRKPQATACVNPLRWYEALVLSVSSFHGRGFLPFTNLGDPVTILAAAEAVIGLFIEVSFIATFTQRYFGK